VTPLPATPRPFSTSRRSAARLAAVQAIYEMEVGGRRASRVIEDYEREGFPRDGDAPKGPASDKSWFGDVVTGVEKGRTQLDLLIQGALEKEREVDKLDAVLRAVLRAGTFELAERRDVPARVVISEYVDVAHAFYFGGEPNLVNAVLDRIAHKVREPEVGKNA